MKSLLILFAISILLLPFYTAPQPVMASDPTVGLWMQTGTNTKVQYTGNKEVKNGKVVYEYKAIIDSAPSYLDNGVKIDCNWHFGGSKWYIGPNLFSAEVDAGIVTISYNDVKYSWDSSISVDGKIVSPDYKDFWTTNRDDFNPNYISNTLVQKYGNIERHLRVIEGMISELWVIPSNPNADIALNIAKTKDNAYTWEKEPFAFDANNNRIDMVNFTVSKDEFNRKDIVYPIYIDPTSSFYSSASDGYLEVDGSGYAAVRTVSSAEYIIDGSTQSLISNSKSSGSLYYIDRAFVYFDTSLVSGNISSASLNLYGFLKDVSAYSLVIQNGQPTYPADPLTYSSFLYTYYTGDGGNITYTSFSTAGYNVIPLTSDGMSWINIGGQTKLCLRSSGDINGTTPAAYNDLRFYCYEQGADYRPYLEVTYGATAVPTVITNAATDVTMSTAKLHGLLSNDGGGECTYAFEYGTSTGVYTTNTTWSASNITTGNLFSESVSSLIQGTSYFYKAMCLNEIGIGFGAEQTFTTGSSFGAPAGFVAVPISSSEVALSWLKNSGADETLIRYKEGEFPTSVTDGFVTYNGTLGAIIQESLSPGVTVYFKAWSYATGNYSTSVQDAATPFPALGGDSAISDLNIPGSMYQALDDSKLHNMPGYETMNATAVDIEMSTASLINIIVLALSLLAGSVMMVFGNGNIILTALGAVIIMAGGVSAGVVPMWIPIIFSMVALALSLIFARSF